MPPRAKAIDPQGRLTMIARGAGRLFLCIALAAGSAMARPSGQIAVGGLLPDVLMRGLNGPARHLADYRGRPLIIHVWASWCGPCIDEMPSLERLAWSDEQLPFALIGISTDDYPERARALLDRQHATIRHFIDHDLQLETLLGASTIPLTVLVDAQGRVIERVRGQRQWDSPDSLQLIRRAFGAPPGRGPR